MPNISIFPPDTLCWLSNTNDTFSSLDDATRACEGLGLANVTDRMTDFLNLTNFDNYFQAYCTNPQADDSCPFNICPNDDVAGPLTRVSIYLSSFLLAILIYYSHDIDKIRDSYWAQNFTIYSVLVAAGIQMAQQNISKMHAIVATEFVGSPLTFYLMFYAVRSAFGNRHRLSELFDGHRRWYRLVALCTFAAWAVFLGVSIGRNHKHFAQSNCEWRMEIMKAVYFLPVALVIALAEVHPTIALVIALPPLIVAVSWSTAIFLRRKTLWYPNGVRRWPTFFEVWTLVGNKYPFTHFMSVCTFPFIIWITTIEMTLWGSNDKKWNASFGQVLALFVALPPLIDVLKISPKFGRWFADLAWVRLITLRRQRLESDEHVHIVALPLDPVDLDLLDSPTVLGRTKTEVPASKKWDQDDDGRPLISKGPAKLDDV